MILPCTLGTLRHEDVAAAIRDLRRAMKRGPVLVHCEHGANRTGLVTALSTASSIKAPDKEEAIEEMQGGHFGFHDVWQYPGLIRDTPIEKLREALGAN